MNYFDKGLGVTADSIAYYSDHCDHCDHRDRLHELGRSSPPKSASRGCPITTRSASNAATTAGIGCSCPARCGLRR